jgi:hypothetical protein
MSSPMIWIVLPIYWCALYSFRRFYRLTIVIGSVVMLFLAGLRMEASDQRDSTHPSLLLIDDTS